MIKSFFRRASNIVLCSMLLFCTTIFAQNKQNSFVLKANLFPVIDEQKAEVLKRYFAGNVRWELKEERGKVYANWTSCAIDDSSKLKTTGFDFSGRGNRKSGTIVLVSFGTAVGLADREQCIVLNRKSTKFSQRIFNDENGGQWSCLIYSCEKINIEILESFSEGKGSLAKVVLEEIAEELNAVLLNEKEINEKGKASIKKYYPVLKDSILMEIQPTEIAGEYLIASAYKNCEEGSLFVKAFELKSNSSLSKKTLILSTLRMAGWDKDCKQVFGYSTLVRLYEKSLKGSYSARFELWLKNKTGQEKKLNEGVFAVKGWGR